jgi:hypothetical protein
MRRHSPTSRCSRPPARRRFALALRQPLSFTPGSSAQRARVNVTLMKPLLLVCAVLMILLNGCVHVTSKRPQQIASLPSGKKIKILSITRMQYSDSPPGLVLKYQTDLKTTDLISLRKEVDEIWPIFKIDVEKARVTNAIITATEAPTGSGLITHTKMKSFLYDKVNGKWQLNDKGK